MPLGSGWQRIGFRPSCGISYPRCRSDSRLISINPFRHAIRQKIMRLDGRRRMSGIVVQNRVADWSRAPQGCVVVPGRRPNHVGGARSQASRGVGAADRGKAVSWKAALYLIGLERSGPGSSRSCNLRTAGEASEASWRRPRSHPSRSAHPVSPLQPWIERRESAGLFARGPVVHWRNGLAAGGNRIRLTCARTPSVNRRPLPPKEKSVERSLDAKGKAWATGRERSQAMLPFTRAGT